MPASSVAIVSNVALAFVPMDEIVVKQTITISASMTAYSTAVGPSSDVRKRCTFWANLIMDSSTHFKWQSRGRPKRCLRGVA